MPTPTRAQRQAAERYVRRIRNDRKRAYADAVLTCELAGNDPEHVDPHGLSVMAQQAVVFNLSDLLHPPRS